MAACKDLVKCLEPFETATTFFSAEKHSTISCVIPIICGLLDQLRDSAEDAVAMKYFKASVREDLISRFHIRTSHDWVKEWIIVATTIDPRFKSLRFLAEDEAITDKEELEERMQSIETNEPEVQENIPVTEDEPKSKRSKLDALLGIEETGGTSTETDELQENLAERNQPHSTDPLCWWKKEMLKYRGPGRVSRCRHRLLPGIHVVNYTGPHSTLYIEPGTVSFGSTRRHSYI